MKRALHVVTHLFVGGIETWLLNMLQRIDRRRYMMDVVEVGRYGRLGDLAGAVAQTGSKVFSISNGNPARFYPEFQRLAGQYDVVLSHTTNFNTLFAFSAIQAMRQRPRRVMFYHNVVYHNDRYAWPAVGINQRMADGLVAVSQAVANAWTKPDSTVRHKLSVLHYGVDLHRFAPGGPVAVIQGWDGRQVVGHVGRFAPVKNQAQFVRVAAEVLRQRPETRFLLVGDGPTRAETEALAARLGIADQLCFTGRRLDVPELMRAMTVTFYPSHHEGSPVSFAEAQACGVPVISGTKPELREAICPENHTWCSVDVHDVTASAQAVIRLLDDAALRGQIAQRGRAWTAAHFSVEQSVAGLQGLIEAQAQGRVSAQVLRHA